MTFEEAHVRVEMAIAARPVRASAKAMAEGGGGGPLNQICSVYAIIKPILQAIESVPFFPKNWKKVIDDFFAIMDKLCPSGGAEKKAAGGAVTFEQIDKRVKDALTAHWNRKPAKIAVGAEGLDLGGIAQQFCDVYKAIKPILDFASLFVPAAWKAGIIAFTTVADMVCKPQT